MDFSKIKNISKKRGIILKELSDMIGMSEANFYKCVKRNSIESKYLEKIAEVLEVPVGYFFEDDKKISSSNINTGGVQAINTGKINVQMSDYQAEISVLRSRVAELERTIRGNEALIEELRQRIIDKEDMIELLREKC